MAALGTVGETPALSGAGNLDNGSTLSSGVENNPVTPGGQVNTPGSVSAPAQGGSPQVRDPSSGVVGSDSESDTSGNLTVPPLGSLTPQNPGTATINPSTAAAAPTASASNIGMLSQAAASDVGDTTNANASNVGPLAGLTNGQIDPNDSTNSASQLDAITAQNSPYIQLAEQQGLLTAASRGLENSSLAAGSAQAAATAAAAPLAQQNASEASTGQLQNSQLDTQVSEANAAAANAAKMQNSQLDTQASEFNSSQDTAAKELAAQLGTSVSQSNAQLATSNNEFNAQQTQAAAAANAAATNSMAAQTAALTEDMNKQDLSGTQAQKLADIQAQSNNLIATNQSASSMYSSYLSSMSSTMANQNISPQRAADTITAMQSMLQSGLSVIDQMDGMSLDLTMPTTEGSGSDFNTFAPGTSATGGTLANGSLLPNQPGQPANRIPN